MHHGDRHRLRSKLKRIANETAELPGIRLLAEPLYRQLFRQPSRHGNAYYGVYDSYAQALAEVPATMPGSYDLEVAGRIYHDRLDRVRVSDYPLLFWLSRLIAAGQRRIFDLGGHIGISYYGFRRHLDYPPDLRWQVHDVPAVVSAGRTHACEHDPEERLQFTESCEHADGSDVLLSSGTLQYLDYSLPELLRRLARPPRHVLVNLTPMHPTRGFYTLQNMRIAICPYRVTSAPEFIAQMKNLGYEPVDRWESFERNLRVPFASACAIDSYSGFYFRLDTTNQPPDGDEHPS